MIIWMSESEIIIQANVINIPESVPEAVDTTALYYEDSGNGLSVNFKLNLPASGAGKTVLVGSDGLKRKSYRKAEFTTEPKAPGPELEVAFTKTTASYLLRD